jgi:hypothetical protein
MVVQSRASGRKDMHNYPPARSGWERLVAGCRVRTMVCDAVRQPGVGDCDACPCFLALYVLSALSHRLRPKGFRSRGNRYCVPGMHVMSDGDLRIGKHLRCTGRAGPACKGNAQSSLDKRRSEQSIEPRRRLHVPGNSFST